MPEGIRPTLSSTSWRGTAIPSPRRCLPFDTRATAPRQRSFKRRVRRADSYVADAPSLPVFDLADRNTSRCKNTGKSSPARKSHRENTAARDRSRFERCCPSEFNCIVSRKMKTFASIALLAGMAVSMPAFAQSPDPGANAVKGGAEGATTGAIIGCIVTIPVGCAPGAAVGAAVGGGVGAVGGAASTPVPPPPAAYYAPPPPVTPPVNEGMSGSSISRSETVTDPYGGGERTTTTTTINR